MSTQLTSREFNQDTGRAKRAAKRGPVYITDRGEPAYVLLSYEAYRRLAGAGRPITDQLGEPDGVGDVDFEPPRLGDLAQAAEFD